jgi:predicted metal-dependent HD superfamily phosphohydrolase
MSQTPSSGQIIECLHREYHALWADYELAQNQFSDLCSMYATGRRYHGLRHLYDMFQEPETATASREVKLAIFFHDAVMNFGRSTISDELASIENFSHMVREQGDDPSSDSYRKVSFMITSTPEYLEPRSSSALWLDGDIRLFLDLDLAILGQPRQRFDEYEQQIRDEYAHVTDNVFRLERAKILKKFLGLSEIYQTPSIKRRYEETARANLTRSLAQLEARS